jgi:hypothetical protein
VREGRRKRKGDIKGRDMKGRDVVKMKPSLLPNYNMNTKPNKNPLTNPLQVAPPHPHRVFRYPNLLLVLLPQQFLPSTSTCHILFL